ncbi:hypothetical protein CMI37_10950 [Candidatus Pacearchaeota archaeon]|nr:hypothetical protein [Candidatus Pacearchaeota archaeon]|tara:strand:+ start:552 stop:848 length:297 start_codon:yes stop_codon:yes gene_type:complete
MDKEYTELDHRYILQVDQEELFHACRSHVPSILSFLQDKSLIKGYSLDNCSNLGSKDKGFVLGRLTFRTDIHIDIDGYILKFCVEELDEEGENTNDRK